MKLARRSFLGGIAAAVAGAFTPPATRRLKAAARKAASDPHAYEKRIASYGNLMTSEPGGNWVIAKW